MHGHAHVLLLMFFLKDMTSYVIIIVIHPPWHICFPASKCTTLVSKPNYLSANCAPKSMVFVFLNVLPFDFLCFSMLTISFFALQGCEVFSQAHGPSHGQEGESHHTVCNGDGQIARLCQNSVWNLQARIRRKGTLAPALHHVIEKFKDIVPTPPASIPSTPSVADEAGQMPAEYRQREHTRIKCIFCHILFFSHAVKCRGLEATFNHWCVERCSSLRQDPEAPLAVQICLEK